MRTTVGQKDPGITRINKTCNMTKIVLIAFVVLCAIVLLPGSNGDAGILSADTMLDMNQPAAMDLAREKRAIKRITIRRIKKTKRVHKSKFSFSSKKGAAVVASRGGARRYGDDDHDDD